MFWIVRRLPRRDKCMTRSLAKMCEQSRKDNEWNSVLSLSSPCSRQMLWPSEVFAVTWGFFFCNETSQGQNKELSFDFQVAIPCMINFTKTEASTRFLYTNISHSAEIENVCGPRPWLFPENLSLDFNEVNTQSVLSGGFRICDVCVQFITFDVVGTVFSTALPRI